MTSASADDRPDLRHPAAIKSREAVFKAFRGVGIAGESITVYHCDEMAAAAAGVLSLDSKISARAAYETLMRRMSGRKATAKLMYESAAAMAGNRDMLVKGDPVPPWDGKGDVWTVLEAIDVQKDGVGFKRVFLMSACGPPAGQVFHPRMSDRYIQFLIREIGYPKFKPCDSMEIFNTWMTCLVSMDGTHPKLTKVSASNQQRGHNSGLRKTRHGGCPLGKPTECHDCPNGLDKCGGAVRPATLARAPCGQCGLMIWSDPNKAVACNKCARVNQ